jgi:hypothetical protein
MTETYKGRKLKVVAGKGREWGTIKCYVNGQLVVCTAGGKSLEDVMAQLRRDVDAVEIDLRPNAYADYWYAAA